MTRLFRDDTKHSWRTKFFLFTFAATAICISVFAPQLYKPKLRDYWSESNLSFASLEHLTSHCADGEREFLGCLRAVETVLQFLQKPQHLKLNTNPVTSIELIEDKLAPPNNSERHAFYFQGFAAKVNFQQLFLQLRSIALPSKDESLLSALAFNAWLSELDPHAGILPKDYVRDIEQTPAKNGGTLGVGINFRQAANRCLITSVVRNSPADKAGVLAGDQLDTVDAHSCSAYTSFQISEILRDNMKANQTLRLVLSRQGKSQSYTLRPEKLNTNSVLWQRQGNFAYMQLQNFYQLSTCELVADALREIDKLKLKGIIMDLRNNPGGYIEEAACVAGLFLGQNVALANFLPVPLIHVPIAAELGVQEPSKSGSAFALLSSHAQLSSLPLVLLINHATASSAEILAGALKEYSRAWLVGSRSFGKGTMQTTSILENFPKIQFTQTTHRIILPSGRELQIHGVSPHFPGPVMANKAPREDILFPQARRPLEAAPESVIVLHEKLLKDCIYKEKQILSDESMAIQTLQCLTH